MNWIWTSIWAEYKLTRAKKYLLRQRNDVRFAAKVKGIQPETVASRDLDDAIDLLWRLSWRT